MAEKEAGGDGTLEDDGTHGGEGDGEGGEQHQQQPTAEERARRMGWVPKDEFRGDPKRWRPAADFIARAETELPVAQATIRRLESGSQAQQRKIDGLVANVRELTETLTEFRTFATKGEERAYNRAKAELEAEFKVAVEAGDVPRAEAARDELADLGEPPKAPVAKKPGEEKPAAGEQPQIEPETLQWIDENPWFNRDPELNDFATNMHGTLLRTKSTLSLAENLDEVKRRTMLAFPEKFPAARKPNGGGAARVAEPSGGGRPRPTGGQTYDDLPADAKKACDRFVKQIPGYTRDEYVKQFDWSAA